jgi:hypothetical protein
MFLRSRTNKVGRPPMKDATADEKHKNGKCNGSANDVEEHFLAAHFLRT